VSSFIASPHDFKSKLFESPRCDRSRVQRSLGPRRIASALSWDGAPQEIFVEIALSREHPLSRLHAHQFAFADGLEMRALSERRLVLIHPPPPVQFAVGSDQLEQVRVEGLQEGPRGEPQSCAGNLPATAST